MSIYVQQALCTTKRFFQSQTDFVLDISSTAWSGRSPSSAVPTAAKDIGEKVGIRKITTKEIFQIFSCGVLCARALTGS